MPDTARQALNLILKEATLVARPADWTGKAVGIRWLSDPAPLACSGCHTLFRYVPPQGVKYGPGGTWEAACPCEGAAVDAEPAGSYVMADFGPSGGGDAYNFGPVHAFVELVRQRCPWHVVDLAVLRREGALLRDQEGATRLAANLDTTAPVSPPPPPPEGPSPKYTGKIAQLREQLNAALKEARPEEAPA